MLKYFPERQKRGHNMSCCFIPERQKGPEYWAHNQKAVRTLGNALACLCTRVQMKPKKCISVNRRCCTFDAKRADTSEVEINSVNVKKRQSSALLSNFIVMKVMNDSKDEIMMGPW